MDVKKKIDKNRFGHSKTSTDIKKMCEICAVYLIHNDREDSKLIFSYYIKK